MNDNFEYLFVMESMDNGIQSSINSETGNGLKLLLKGYFSQMK